MSQNIIKVSNLILGAGMSGLSASYHLSHKNCVVLEKKLHSFGLLKSTVARGFVWDQGPHVSFTKHEYVRAKFVEFSEGKYCEHQAKPKNYFYGDWVDHPVQANLYQVPKDVRDKCVSSFLECEDTNSDTVESKCNYKLWLQEGLGKQLTDTFVAPYTRKYWTTEPENLTVDWVGPRVYRPSREEFIKSTKGPLEERRHYIKKIRYPENGGYETFVKPLAKGANIHHGVTIDSIDLSKKHVSTKDGRIYEYERLISTIPIMDFLGLIDNVDEQVINSAQRLESTQLLLVNVEVPVELDEDAQWLYVYDEDMFTTRITMMSELSKGNSPKGASGIQVEVYFSKYKKISDSHESIRDKVVEELYKIGIIPGSVSKDKLVASTQWVPRANIIFDHNRRKSLTRIFDYLEKFGLERREDELDSGTDWTSNPPPKSGDLILLGRFGEWKYYWSDDCFLAGKNVSSNN